MSDLISRQAAIDAMAELQGRAYTKAELKRISKALKRIKRLPSAQPQDIARDIANIIENEKDMRVIAKNAQPEIIRCKDCKHFWLGQCGLNGLTWSYDSFCSRAERREE